MTQLSRRHDFVYFFDVANGNPNGDPDANNLPRLDPETSIGLVTDVCIKRKIRDYVSFVGGEGNGIFIKSRVPLNSLLAKACESKGLNDFRKSDGSWDTKAAKTRPQDDIRVLQDWLCAQYFDVRTFGAVMSTGPNAGQIRGPVQFSFAKSQERIVPVEVSVVRVTDVDKEEGEMGRKYVVPYGLYRMHGFVSAKFAERTQFSEEDLELLFEALKNLFEHDRSAARGEMSARRLIVFRHASALGNAPAHALFDRITVHRTLGCDTIPVGDSRLDNFPPARAFTDYRITVDLDDLPPGVEALDLV